MEGNLLSILRDPCPTLWALFLYAEPDSPRLEAFSCLGDSSVSHIIINGSPASEGFQRPGLPVIEVRPYASECYVEEEFY